MKYIISGGVYLGNDTSRESFADNFTRNRDEAFVQSHSKKWHSHFFDSLRAAKPPFQKFSALLRIYAAFAAGALSAPHGRSRRPHNEVIP